jgi:hypothetical protein
MKKMIYIILLFSSLLTLHASVADSKYFDTNDLDAWLEEVYDQEFASTAFENPIVRSKENNNLDGNPYIPSKIKKQLRPYLIPQKHPMKGKLDAIFLEKRATANEQTFTEAGFKTFSIGKRSFVYVAKHPLLPHHIVKAYLDNDNRKKYGKESWEWLVKRCQGAEKIRNVIKKKGFKHFVVADKWIYPLPAHPSPPPLEEGYVRHHAILIAKNMNLAPKKENYRAWRTKITREHLDELYVIISRAKGSSYRPDNIALTKEGLFAFIDTEYPAKGPDYKSIRLYLNREMRKYWDKLVKNGGV